MTSSISSTVAMPSCTSHSASRHSASWSRSPMNASISFATTTGFMPSEAYTSRARPTAAAEVARPPTTSTRGSRYTGLKGCPTSNRPGCARSRCMSLGSSPEVEDPMTTFGRRRRVHLGEDRAFEVEPLRHALLDELRAFDGGFDARHDPQRASGRAGVAEQAREDALGVVEDLVRLAFGLGVRIVDGGVDPVQHEPGRPPAADDPAADARGALDVGHRDVLLLPLLPASSHRFVPGHGGRVHRAPPRNPPLPAGEHRAIAAPFPYRFSDRADPPSGTTPALRRRYPRPDGRGRRPHRFRPAADLRARPSIGTSCLTSLLVPTLPDQDGGRRISWDGAPADGASCGRGRLAREMAMGARPTRSRGYVPGTALPGLCSRDSVLVPEPRREAHEVIHGPDRARPVP